MTLKPPVRIAVTGAAGQIAYATLFRIAGGIMLGRDQPVILQLLDLPQAQQALRGVIMEMQDCAFPLLADIFATDDPEVAFKDADIALLIGARPRTQGMERADLLHANAEIFKIQGAALNKVANRNVKVLVVGNPANTNAYIAMKSAPDIPPENFTALMRLDHHRAVSQIAEKINRPITSIEQMCVWGNHSPTMYADYRFATIGGESVKDLINAVGAGFGASFDLDAMRYPGGIVIATDADPDGSHIATLLYVIVDKLFPGLIDAGLLFQVKTPLAVVSVKNGDGAGGVVELPAFTLSEAHDMMRQLADAGLSYSTDYMKGLGESTSERLHQYAFSSEKCWQRVERRDVEETERVLDVIFGGDTEKRKEWIMGLDAGVEVSD